MDNKTVENSVKVENKEKKVNKKVKGKRKRASIISIFCIALIVIVIALLIVLLMNKGKIRVIKTATNEIDMTNTENVEIVDGKKVNNATEIKTRQHVENLSCQILELTADENKSKLVMEVRNETDEKFVGKKATIIFFEKEGRVFGELNTFIGDIAVGEKITLELTTTLDVANAYSYTVEVEKSDEMEEKINI